MHIASSHKENKKNAYWDDLIQGTTSQYKEAVMNELIKQNMKIRGEKLLDIGCGTCETILKYAKVYQSKSLTCLDYDAKVIEKMKQKLSNEDIIWKVADIFDINGWSERFDIVFFMDMLHEIYSFYGRPNKDIQCVVEHDMGQKFVKDAIKNVARLLNKGGGMIITDNVLCAENKEIRVQLKTNAVKEAVTYFLKNYPTRKFDVHLDEKNVLTINSRDFCILLTQYNKIKHQDFDRWNVERFEIHQYMTLQEYADLFESIHFSLHAVVGTPQKTMQEWEEDFKVLDGLPGIPEKRITLLAIKK